MMPDIGIHPHIRNDHRSSTWCSYCSVLIKKAHVQLEQGAGEHAVPYVRHQVLVRYPTVSLLSDSATLVEKVEL
jgi:hypothetical protein